MPPAELSTARAEAISAVRSGDDDRDESLALSFLSAFKALLNLRPWAVVEGADAGAIDAAAQAAARGVAATLARLRGLVGAAAMGDADADALAARAAAEPPPDPRGLFDAELVRALRETGSGADDARRRTPLSESARSVLVICARLLLAHAAATRRVAAAAVDEDEGARLALEAARAVRSSVDALCADVAISNVGPLCRVLLASRRA